MKPVITYYMLLCLLGLSSLYIQAQECEIGYVELTNQTEIAAFAIEYQDCKELNGNLTIIGADVVDIGALSYIESIDTLQIHYTSIDSLSTFTNLKEAGLVRVWRNDSLRYLADFNEVLKCERFLLSQNDNLLFVSTMNMVDSLARHSITENRLLDTVKCLKKLRYSATSIGITMNPNLRYIEDMDSLEMCKFLGITNTLCEQLPSFKKLKKIGVQLFLKDLRYVKNFQGLNQLEQVARIIILKNHNLENFSGFDNLQRVTGDLHIENASNSVQEIDGFHQLKYIGGFIDFRGMPKLEMLNGFEQLDTVGSLKIGLGSKLTQIDAFQNLSYIRDSLEIRYHGKLNKVNGFQNMAHVPIIHLNRNYVLDDISFFESIDTSTLQYLTIVDNDSLTICNSRPMCAYLSNPSNEAEISGNAPGCATRVEVVESCSKYLSSWLGRRDAEWHYCVDDGASAYEVFHSVVDTFAAGGLKYSVLGGDYISGVHRDTTFTVASDIDRVYYEEGDSLHLLYDFGVSVGDTVRLRFPVGMYADYYTANPDAPRYFELLIRHVADVGLGNDTLRRVFFSVLPMQGGAESLLDLGGYYTEGIGYEHYIMPYIVSDTGGVHNYSGRYYRDHRVNLSLSYDQSCEQSTVSAIDEESTKVEIYPNPTSGRVYIVASDSYDRVVLYNILGDAVYRTAFSEELDITGMARGVYMLHLASDTGKSCTTRLIVE